MAHNIAKIDNADAMFCVGDRQAAWHLLGQRCDKAATWEEAIVLAKLDWPVLTSPLYARNPVDGKVTEIKGYKEVWRGNGNSAPLGIVGDDFHHFQNKEAFAFGDELLQAHKGAHWESAGALGQGEKIWALARVPGADISIKGTKDVSKSYLLVATGHTGNMAFLSRLCSERVVCENTFNVALSEAGQMLKIRHTKNAAIRLENAKKFMQSVVVDAQSLQTKLNLLAGRQMTKTSMISVINRIFGDVETETVNSRRNNVIMKVLELFESNDNNAIPQIRGTAYNMFNAVTEYVDHFRGSRVTSGRAGVINNDQARAQGAMFGSGDKMKGQALVALLEETEANPATDTRNSSAFHMSDADFLKSLNISMD